MDKLICALLVQLLALSLNCKGQSDAIISTCKWNYSYCQGPFQILSDSIVINSRLHFKPQDYKEFAKPVYGYEYFETEIDHLMNDVIDKFDGVSDTIVLEMNIGINGKLENTTIAHSSNSILASYVTSYFLKLEPEWFPAIGQNGSAILSYLQLILYIHCQIEK